VFVLNREQQRAYFAKTKLLNPKKLDEKHYFSYNKDNIGGLQFSAKNKKEAKQIANDHWGRGAKFEPDTHSDLLSMYGGDELKVATHQGMIPNRTQNEMNERGIGSYTSADRLGLKLQKSGIYAKPSKLASGGFVNPHTK